MYLHGTKKQPSEFKKGSGWLSYLGPPVAYFSRGSLPETTVKKGHLAGGPSYCRWLAQQGETVVLDLGASFPFWAGLKDTLKGTHFGSVRILPQTYFETEPH